MAESINHPDHYNQGGMEVIDVIEAFTKDCSGVEAFCVGNVIKYTCRFKKKNGLEDLKKAKWYLNKLIDIYIENGMSTNHEEDFECKKRKMLADLLERKSE